MGLTWRGVQPGGVVLTWKGGPAWRSGSDLEGGPAWRSGSDLKGGSSLEGSINHDNDNTYVIFKGRRGYGGVRPKNHALNLVLPLDTGNLMPIFDANPHFAAEPLAKKVRRRQGQWCPRQQALWLIHSLKFSKNDTTSAIFSFRQDKSSAAQVP